MTQAHGTQILGRDYGRMLVTVRRSLIALALGLAVAVSSVSADEHGADETGSQGDNGSTSELALTTDSASEDDDQDDSLALRRQENLAAFDMMERAPGAYTSAPEAESAAIEENLAAFDMMEQAPGAYTGSSETSTLEIADNTLTHPWGGDSLDPDY